MKGVDTMSKTHLSGPLIVGDKQVTDNTTISLNSQVFSATVVKAEAENLQATVNSIITALKNAGIIK